MIHKSVYKSNASKINVNLIYLNLKLKYHIFIKLFYQKIKVCVGLNKI